MRIFLATLAFLATATMAHAETVNLTFCKTEAQIVEYVEAVVKTKTPWKQALANMNKSGEVCKTGVFSFKIGAKKDAFVHESIKYIVVEIEIIAAHQPINEMMSMVLPYKDKGFVMQFVAIKTSGA